MKQKLEAKESSKWILNTSQRGVAWLVHLVQHATFGLGVVGLTSMLGIEIILKNYIFKKEKDSKGLMKDLSNQKKESDNLKVTCFKLSTEVEKKIYKGQSPRDFWYITSESKYVLWGPHMKGE